MIPAHAVDDAEPGDRPATSRAIEHLANAVVAVAVALVHLGFSDPERGPRIMADEAGYLANAIFLGTGDVVNMRDTAFYSGGYSLLLTPLAWWFGDDRQGLYESVVLVQSLLAAVVVLLVTWIVRRLLDVSPGVALTAGAIAGLTPAHVMHSGLSWSEAILMVVGVAAFALVLRLLDSPGATRVMSQALGEAAPAGLALGALAAVHRRMLLPALVVLAVVALKAVLDRRPWTIAAAGVSFLAVVAAGALLDGHLERHVWAGEAVDIGMSSKVDGLRTWDGLSATLAAATGQVWYLLVASVGLAGAAIMACIEGVRRPRRLDGSGWFCVALLGAILSLVAVSAVFVGSATHQAEYLIYGRYSEALSPLLVGIGFAWLTTATARRLTIGCTAVVAATFGSWFVVAVVQRDWIDRSLNRVVVPGVVDWALPDAQLAPLLRGTIVTVAVTVTLTLLALMGPLRARPALRTAACALIVLGAWSWQLVAIREHIIVPLRTNAEGIARLVEPVRSTGAGHLGVDPALGGGARVGLSLRLPGVVVGQDDGTTCVALVPAAGAEERGDVLDRFDSVALVERPSPCRT